MLTSEGTFIEHYGKGVFGCFFAEQKPSSMHKNVQTMDNMHVYIIGDESFRDFDNTQGLAFRLEEISFQLRLLQMCHCPVWYWFYTGPCVHR